MKSRSVTIAEVARAAGVSAMTVSYTFSQPGRVAETTREHVLRVADELGFVGPDPSARSLRRGRVGSIGVVLGEHLGYAFEDPQARRFLAGAAAACREHGSGMTLMPSTGAPRDLERLRDIPADGYILWTTYRSDPVIEYLRSTPKPVVVHGGPRIRDSMVVSIDNRAAAASLADVCFRGARSPAVLSFPFGPDRRSRIEHGIDLSRVEFPVTADRLLGISDQLGGRGFDLDGVLVAVASRNDRAGAVGMVRELLDEGVDAILAMSDELALAVLDVATERRLTIPDDLSVAGWDGSETAELVGLTTVVQSLYDQGRTAALGALGHEVSSQQPTWELVERASTRRR